MKARPIIISLLLAAIFIGAASQVVYAVYYTIQLTNGNEIKSDKYWEDGDMVRFYTKEGVVGIPKKLIGKIVTSTGTIDLQTQEQVLEAIKDEQQSEQSELPAAAEVNKNEERLNDIKDQIVVIESNLETLTKNRTLYTAQLEQYQQQKQKSEERVRALTSDRFVTAKDSKESIEFEQSKIKDFEDKIREAEEKIQRTDKMIEAQKRMRERLEGELARAQK